MGNQNVVLNRWEEREVRVLAIEYVELLMEKHPTYAEPLKFKIEARENNHELALLGSIVDARGVKQTPIEVYFGSYNNMEEVKYKKEIIDEELRKQCHEYVDALANTHRNMLDKESQNYILLTKVSYMNFEVLGLHPNNNNTLEYLVDLFTSEVASLDEEDKDDETIDYNKTDFANVKELMDWYEEIMMAFDEYYQINFVTPQEVAIH